MQTSDNSIGLLLLSGAGMGSWMWRDVTKNLTAPMVAVDFPKTDPAAGMKEYVAAARKQAEALKTDKIIIVGHSLAGTVGLKVAEELGDRTAGYVAIAAAIPKNGQSFVSSLPFPQKLIMPIIIRLAGTKPPESSIRQSYCNDLDEQLANEVVSRYEADPKKVYLEPSALPPRVPKLYIKTTKDTDYPSAMQDAMSSNLGADKVVAIDSGHLPMLAKPAELATVLNEFVQVFIGSNNLRTS